MIEAYIGYGSYGVVLKGSKENRTYAIKAIFAEDKDLTQKKFLLEKEILQHIKHFRIPNFVEAFTVDNVHYLVQDYVDGYPLSYLFGNGQVFTEDYVIGLLRQLLPIIAYLHESSQTKKAIIHRDLRLSNLLIQDDNLYLIDFGLARFVEQNSSTKDPDIFETDEQGERPISESEPLRKPGVFTYKVLRKAISPQSDLFGVGVVAIDLLSSQITDEVSFEQPWQKVLPISTPFMTFLEKLLSREDCFMSAEEALTAIRCLSR